MSLINSTRDITRIGLKEGVRYRALVTENWDVDAKGDQRFLGRIKFNIPKFFEFDLKFSPWAIPQSNGADGASPKSGHLNVPRIGSYVDIMFMGGSVYHPVYLPCTIFETVVLEEAKINYPNRKIHRLENGFMIIVDEKANSVEIYDPGDFQLKTMGVCNLVIEGNVNINSKTGNITCTTEKGNVNVKSAGLVDIQVDGATNLFSKGTVSVTTDGVVNLKGTKGGKLAGVVTGNHNCMVTGAPHNACSSTIFAT
jgi:hypothetical protein